MGRRRRFTQQPTSDDDDDDRAAPQVPKATKPAAPASSGTKKQQRHSADEDDDEDDLELEEKEEDEKDLEEMRRNEEEERREETQTRRRRGCKPKRPAEETEEEAESEEEEAREEESTEAVPIGEPVKVTGKGKKQRKHYYSFEYEGNTFELEDPVLLTPEQQNEKPYVAIIKDITENDGSLSVTGQWFYRPEEADKKGGGNWIASDTRELFYSFHIDDVPADVAKISNNGSSTRDTGSGDNENSYPPDVVVSIMASLERATYEAFPSDFQKYNQKMRKLEFNIKNSPVLRRRLMNKELDPPVLLTMSPDELKAGLTPAEKTSEPEESRRLQMTDARCERCTEKKVGIADIIHAGHGDRYQLECISCGHTWFSSRDAISSLTVDAPSTGGNVGTAPWATAKFDVLQKQLASPRDQPDKQPGTDALQKSTVAAMPKLEKQKSFIRPKPDEPSSMSTTLQKQKSFTRPKLEEPAAPSTSHE
ncbi:hypothetical protein ACQ4PT_053247 [Festuca glaucescens]